MRRRLGATAVCGSCGVACRECAQLMHDERKKAFHAAYKKAFRDLANRLGLRRGDYDVSSNMGGPAVMGDVVLHTEFAYVQACGTAAWLNANGEEMRLLVRTCKGRQDVRGGENRWLSRSALAVDMASALLVLREIAKEQP